MNYKATAILVVVALALASVGAVALSDHAQAADSDDVYNQGNLQVTSQGATRTFQVNEQQFAGYVYVLTWKVGTVIGTGEPDDTSSWTTIITSTHSGVGSPPSFTDVANGATVGNPESQFTVRMNDVEGVVGKYELSVESNAPADTRASIGLQCQIEVTIGGIKKPLAEVYYIFDLVKVDAASSSMTLDAVNNLIVGKTFGNYVVETSGTIGTISDYYWYAVDLPEGVTMSEGGYVSGAPLESGKFTAKVVATHKTTGETFEGKMSVEVAPATQAMNNYYFVVNINDTDQNAGLGTYAVVQGESVILKTFSRTSPSGDPADAASVKVVSEDGTVTDASKHNDATGVYVIPTNGTGAYRVVITMGSVGSMESAEFYLFVSPSLDNIQAGIVITGN